MKKKINKVILEVHLGQWYLIPTGREWRKDYMNAKEADRRLSFLCFSLYVSKKCESYNYLRQWQ